MTVEFRPTLSMGLPAAFDPLLSSLRTGDTLAVRVVTMVDKGVARLSILGQTMDVDTPLPLIDGADLTVTIAKDGNNLKLLVQSDFVNGPSPARVSPGFWAGSAKSAISQAWLTEPSHRNLTPEHMTNHTDGAEFPIQDRIRTRFEIEGGAAEACKAPNLLAKAESERYSLSESHADTVGTHKLAPDVSPASRPHDGYLVPVRLPDLASPLLVRVMPDDAHDRADDDHKPNEVDDPQPRTWSVEFNIEAGEFGHLDINVKLSAGNVSVKLRSEEERPAAPLSSILPELRRALEMVDLTVEALSVEHGKH